jgi:tetratricopeptide (TPR) repeat protein
MLAEAVEHHRAGRLGEAERLYRGILDREPGHVESLHRLGLVASQTGHGQAAEGLIRRAIAAGDARALDFRTSDSEAGQAEKQAALWADLGIALQLQGKLTEAVESYDLAIASCDRAIALESGRQRQSGAVFSNRGMALHALERLDEAQASLRQAIALEPEQPESHTGLGNVLYVQGLLEEAAECHERAIALRPGYAEAWSNLGSVRHMQGLLAEAAECSSRAVLLDPRFAEGYNNLGDALQGQGRLAEAARCFDRAIELKPGLARAHLNRASLRLLEGKFAEGWPEYEWRLRLYPQRKFGLPRWMGEPLGGSGRPACLLLHAEQGLGDTLQFLRYLPLVLERVNGGSVVLEVQPPLLRLAGEMASRLIGKRTGMVSVTAMGEDLPEFDWHCPLMSLPLIFESDLGNLPAESPYLAVPAEAAERVAALPGLLELFQEELFRAGKTLRVGLVWAGSAIHAKDRFRSIAPELLAPLLEVDGARFYSLQVGGPTPNGVAMDGGGFTDLAPYIRDMADTAALLERLDLVIAADTSVAHLAGAMGRPVWVLLPFAPDWRWLADRADSPWYPSMRLFRQTKPGDWAGVIETVREALIEAVAKGAVGLATIGKERVTTETHAASAPGPIAAPAVEPDAVACKVCDSPSLLYGVVDFHKSCIEAQGKRLPLSGVPVYYRRCGRCGLVFTDAFDGWAMEEFESRIYNDAYFTVDPDYVSVRPLANAAMVAETFEQHRDGMRVLDYGGGSGLLAERLREMGFAAESYDPFSKFDKLPGVGFDLITCFEVMEHLPQPRETVREMVSLLGEQGAILFSTLIQPPEMERLRLNWWYAAPRNGHVSLYTPAALLHLFKPHGMRVGSFNAGLHIAYGQRPAFAAHLKLPV